MATTFKTFLNDDVVSTRSLLHEAIPITGTIISGTYISGAATAHPGNESNIKDYPHGMFQSVYDYPYLSSSANHIFDLTLGFPSSSLSSTAYGGGSDTVFKCKKKNIYNQMAQVLMGHDSTGSIMSFDEDGDLVAGGTKLNEVFFINFARLLGKDEIKKGSFTIKLGTANHSAGSPEGSGRMNTVLTITDDGAENDYRVNSPAGEYGILKCSSAGAFTAGATTTIDSETVKIKPSVGLIYYQAGIAVISGSAFVKFGNAGTHDENGDGKLNHTAPSMGNGIFFGASGYDTCGKIHELFGDVSISGACNEIRSRIQEISFNNTTELNSTVYFCRVNHNDFNYSANPTYLSGSKIRVKRSTVDAPVSYITTVGLYSSDNELLAVAKVSEPLRKDPTNEMILRVRLDY